MRPARLSAARRAASALRDGAARETERIGTGRQRGTVLGTDPLRVDLHGSDQDLDADDVTLGRNVARGEPLQVGDVLVLLEVDDGEWVALDLAADAFGQSPEDPDDPGDGGSSRGLEFPFAATTFVTVPHDFGRRPAVAVVDSAGDEVVSYQTRHLSSNALTITFDAPFGGVVILN